MAVLFVAAMPCLASAQYAQTKVGQKLTYTVTDKVNNKTNTVNVITGQTSLKPIKTNSKKR